MWDTETRHCVRTLGGHAADVIALSTSQNFLYSSSVDCTVRVRGVCLPFAHFLMQVWDRRRLACVQTLGDSVIPRPVALRAGSDFIAVAKGQAVQLWKSVVQPAAAVRIAMI